MKKVFMLLTVSLFLFQGFSQSSERISKLIESEQITKGQAAYLAASYLNLIQEEDSDSDAFTALLENKYFSEGDKDSDLVDYATLSYVYAKTFNIKGGLFYTILPAKRYAFNELKAKGILPANCAPTEKVSGRDSIALFSQCSELPSAAKNKGAAGISSSSTLPFEFGGVISNNSLFKTNKEQEFKFDQCDSASLWIKDSLIKTSTVDSYIAAQGTYSFEYNFNSAQAVQYLDLDLLKYVYNRRFGNSSINIAAGRFFTYDATGTIFAQKADGLDFEYKNRDVEVALYAAYTGLLNAQVDTMLGYDLSKLSGDSTKLYDLAEKNIAGIAYVKFPGLFLNQSVVMQGLGTYSFEATPFTRLYATLDISGPLYSIVYYDLNTTFGFTKYDSEDFQLANLSKASLSVYPQFMNSSVSVNAVYASGNQGSLKPFRGITSNLADDSLAQPEYSGIIKAGVAATIKPVSSVLVSAAFDTVFDAADDISYEGIQFSADADWQLLSDVMIGAKYSQFEDSVNAAYNSKKITVKASLKF